MNRLIILSLSLILILFSCNYEKESEKKSESKNQTTGSIERLHPDLDKIISKDAVIEVLAEGFTWSEGPLWLEEQNMLVFTDVPNNVIYRYTDKDSLQVYLKPSGYTGDESGENKSGGNGLLLDRNGNLVFCQHGDRRVARMNASLNNPKPIFETMAGSFDGKRFNSPNDAVFDRQGNLYFTDPPYGLRGQDEDPAKELDFNGVYRLSEKGVVALLTGQQTRPNGIALSPDETTLYVANSDPQQCLWMVYDLNKDGTVGKGRVFFDATSMYNGKNGLADGLKVDSEGNIFATGPGGVLVFSPDGKHLGTIRTGHATANCAFNTNKSVLYMTAHHYLMRIELMPDKND
jgi:gluconolactonase